VQEAGHSLERVGNLLALKEENSALKREYRQEHSFTDAL
jgi:hypothetical protein